MYFHFILLGGPAGRSKRFRAHSAACRVGVAGVSALASGFGSAWGSGGFAPGLCDSAWAMACATRCPAVAGSFKAAAKMMSPSLVSTNAVMSAFAAACGAGGAVGVGAALGS